MSTDKESNPGEQIVGSIVEDLPIKTRIEGLISTNDIVLFMKGTALLPQCGFSAKVVNILESYGLKFKTINVLEDDKMRQGIKDFNDWPTIPQLFLKKEFVGGCDIVNEMHHAGELLQLLKDKNIL